MRIKERQALESRPPWSLPLFPRCWRQALAGAGTTSLLTSATGNAPSSSEIPLALDGSSVTGADGSGHRSASSTSARVVKCARHTKPLAHVEPA